MNPRAEKFLEKDEYGFYDLIELMKILRMPDGCPWDREQTHKSVRNDLIEETYEAVEAIDSGDTKLLKEELGDILLQVTFHSVMSEEAGEFDIDSVIDGVCRKLVIRHPHVFGDVGVSGTKEVLDNWEAIKNKEKSRNTLHTELSEISRALPSLMRSQKVAKKLMKNGIIPKEGTGLTKDEIADALFDLTAEAQRAGINAEQALYEKIDGIIEKQKD